MGQAWLPERSSTAPEWCIHSFIHSFMQSVICLTTGPTPPPERCLHKVRSRASSFKWEYPLLSLRSSSSFFRLLPRLLVTSISPLIFPSITCFRKQFLRKMCPIQLAFRFLISCMIFLCSLTLSNTSSFLTWSVQLIFSILLRHHISKLVLSSAITLFLNFSKIFIRIGGSCPSKTIDYNTWFGGGGAAHAWNSFTSKSNDLIYRITSGDNW